MARLFALQQHLSMSSASCTHSIRKIYTNRHVNQVGPSQIESEFRRRQQFALHRKLESGMRMQQASAHITELCPEGLYNYTVRRQQARQVAAEREETMKGKEVLSILMNWQEQKVQPILTQRQTRLQQLQIAREREYLQDCVSKKNGCATLPAWRKQEWVRNAARIKERNAVRIKLDADRGVPLALELLKELQGKKHTAPQKTKTAKAAPMASKLSAKAAVFTPKASEVAAP